MSSIGTWWCHTQGKLQRHSGRRSWRSIENSTARPYPKSAALLCNFSQWGLTCWQNPPLHQELCTNCHSIVLGEEVFYVAGHQAALATPGVPYQDHLEGQFILVYYHLYYQLTLAHKIRCCLTTKIGYDKIIGFKMFFLCLFCRVIPASAIEV